MYIRLEQMHPSLVHLPIALLPLAVGADLLGRITGYKPLMNFGRLAIKGAAVGAAASATTGLIAGEEVNVEGRSRDILMTHRNLNFTATLVTAGMAAWRAQRKRPGIGYLATGLAGIGVLAYTAYLGGQLVYDKGVAVAPAGGVYKPDAPALGEGRLGEFAKSAATDLVHGVKHMAEEVASGKIVPALTKHGSPSSSE